MEFEEISSSKRKTNNDTLQYINIYYMHTNLYEYQSPCVSTL